MTTIDMQTIRYINLLDNAAHVRTRKCFTYNNTILFAVRREDVSKAIGLNAINSKRIQEKLGKRIKIIPEANNLGDAERFIRNVIQPIQFKSIEIKDNDLIITAGSTQNKAALFGRYKRRYQELNLIIKNVFNKELKIA